MSYPASLSAVPPHVTSVGAEAFLKRHYAEVRQRLTAARPNPKRSHDPHHYPSAIGPVRVVMAMPVSLERLRPSASKLVMVLCREIDVPYEDVVGDARRAHLVSARAKIAHRLRDLGYSSTEIGRRMNRDHSSVLHILKAYDANGEKRHA